MSVFERRFASAKQDWTTPRPLFDIINAEFSFTLDAAASPDNALAERFITKEQDAMTVSWGMGEVVWLNPPYGDVAKYKMSNWVERAYRQSLNGNTVVMLIPARTNTVWFHDLCLGKGEVRFLKGRPKFGDAPHGLPQPLCLVIFGQLARPVQHRGVAA